jgi:16S rRNA processing protein RimM
MTPSHLIIGQILRPHGVRGELRVKLLTDFPERFSQLDVVLLAADPNTLQNNDTIDVERARLHQEQGILKLEGIDSRDEAEALRNHYLLIPLEDAGPLEKDEYYYFQLVGLTVIKDSGETLGEVTEIIETGANYVYVVQSPRYGELLIPAIADVIQSIDLDAGQITITPMPGLLPE